MLRRIAQTLLVLLGGPLVAFGVLFVGCEGSEPVFGVACGHNILPSLVLGTIGAWFVLGTLVALLNGMKGNE